jgi:ATP-dependent DNA helicase RecQ
MSAQERKEIIEKFRNDEVNIVFATNAFGMGIDIPDIRVVIHFMIPESLEQYYQEVGRAARDGAAANAYLLYTNKNIQVKKRFFIDGSFPNEETLKQVYFKITDNSVGVKTTKYFDEDGEIQQCLPYYLEAGLLNIECKAFEDLDKLKNVTDSNVLSFINATKSKNFTTTVKKTGKTAKEIAETVYSSLIAGTADVSKALERWLVINVLEPNISEAKMAEINDIIAAKREYKYELLDYMVWILKEVEGSIYLHQEIARYLGTDKHNLNRIYKTEDGNMVRSKSEVIICNLLYKYNIPYEYEKKLYYADGKWMEPDFTITLSDGTEIYWEHVGMLGNSGYDDRWREKRKLYSQYFPNQLVYTYENGTLSAEAVKIIESKLS